MKFLIVLFVIIVSCKSKEHEVKGFNKQLNLNGTSQIIQIPEISKNNKFSNVVKELEYVPIKKSSNERISKIHKLIYQESRYYILGENKFGSCVYVYDTLGNFLHQIGSTGEGPGQYQHIYDICIDQISREVILHITTGLSYYDFISGNYKKFKRRAFNYTDIVTNNLYIYYASNHQEQFSPYLQQFDLFIAKKESENEIVLSTKINQFNNLNIGANHYFFKDGNNLYYHDVLSDTISLLNGLQVSKNYILDLYNKNIIKRDELLKLNDFEEFKNVSNNNYLFLGKYAICQNQMIFEFLKNKRPYYLLYNYDTNKCHFIDQLLPSLNLYGVFVMPQACDQTYFLSTLDLETYSYFLSFCNQKKINVLPPIPYSNEIEFYIIKYRFIL